MATKTPGGAGGQRRRKDTSLSMTHGGKSLFFATDKFLCVVNCLRHHCGVMPSVTSVLSMSNVYRLTD